MRNATGMDATDASLLLALAQSPRAPVLVFAERVGLSRNTVQARLTSLAQRGVLISFERRIDPAALGYPLTAFVTVQVVQRMLGSADRAVVGEFAGRLRRMAPPAGNCASGTFART